MRRRSRSCRPADRRGRPCHRRPLPVRKPIPPESSRRPLPLRHAHQPAASAAFSNKRGPSRCAPPTPRCGPRPDCAPSGARSAPAPIAVSESLVLVASAVAPSRPSCRAGEPWATPYVTVAAVIPRPPSGCRRSVHVPRSGCPHAPIPLSTWPIKVSTWRDRRVHDPIFASTRGRSWCPHAADFGVHVIVKSAAIHRHRCR